MIDCFPLIRPRIIASAAPPVPSWRHLHPQSSWARAPSVETSTRPPILDGARQRRHEQHPRDDSLSSAFINLRERTITGSVGSVVNHIGFK
jgi:hypothetical protein